jgi:hypothetical protein
MKTTTPLLLTLAESRFAENVIKITLSNPMENKCLECGCELTRNYKCRHNCDMCQGCDPDEN